VANPSWDSSLTPKTDPNWETFDMSTAMGSVPPAAADTGTVIGIGIVVAVRSILPSVPKLRLPTGVVPTCWPSAEA
jgi:hypothetical protein